MPWHFCLQGLFHTTVAYFTDKWQLVTTQWVIFVTTVSLSVSINHQQTTFTFVGFNQYKVSVQIDCNQLKPTSDRLQPTHQLNCNPVVLVPNPVDLGPNPVVLGPNPVDLGPKSVVLGHNSVDLGQNPGVKLCGRILASQIKVNYLNATAKLVVC